MVGLKFGIGAELLRNFLCNLESRMSVLLFHVVPYLSPASRRATTRRRTEEGVRKGAARAPANRRLNVPRLSIS